MTEHVARALVKRLRWRGEVALRYTVAGLYVERTQALLVLSDAYRVHRNSPWTIKTIDHETASWSGDDRGSAEHCLAELMQRAEQRSTHFDGLAIGAYGPFLSLIPEDETNYGIVHPVRAHPPLNGVNYVALFRDTLGNLSPNVPPYLAIHTDATACAVGESMVRNVAMGKVVASIIVGKGIGLGLTQWRLPLPSALHPEIGLLPATISVADMYMRKAQETKSLAQLAANDAMSERAGIAASSDDFFEALNEVLDEELWDLRAEYIAQACLACSAICPPNVISLHPYIDPLGDIGERTSVHFNKLLEELKLAKQPVFRYEDLQEVDFISSTKGSDRFSEASVIASTGALGLCHLAAENIFQRQFGVRELFRQLARNL